MTDPARIKLTVAMTHPVQYFSPWFRHIERCCPRLDLRVVYAARPAANQQGTGFGKSFVWDIPLLDGYNFEIVRGSEAGESFHSDDYYGLDVPELADRTLATRPDVVLLHGWNSVSLRHVRVACRRAGIPILYRGDTHQASFTERTGALRYLLKALWHWKSFFLIHQFSGWLSVGSRVRDHLLRLGVPATSIHASPHCVDNEFFASAAEPWLDPARREAARAARGARPGDFLVLYVGKLDERKKPLDCVRAAARCDFPVHVVVAGTGEQESAMASEARSLNVSIHFAGFVNQTDLPQLYAAADCLTLPGEETWGLVANEALSVGLPVVVSDRAGCAPDLVVEGTTGYCFEFSNMASLAQSWRQLAARTDRTEWRQACRAQAAKHSFASATTGLLAACDAVSPSRHKLPRVVAACGQMVLISGLEKQSFEVLRLLRARGIIVHCIMNSWENHRIVPLAEGIGASWSIGRYFESITKREVDLVKLVLMLADIVRTSAGLLRDALRLNATHIFLPDFMAAIRNFPALIALRVLGVRVILRLGNAPSRAASLDRLFRWGVDPVVDLFVSNSRATQAVLHDLGIDALKSELIYNSIPGDADFPPLDLRPDRLPRTIIYVGQIIPEKGVDLLLLAVALLSEVYPDLRVWIVGRMEGWLAPSYGNFWQELKRLAAQPSLSGRVEFLGQRTDVHRLLHNADVHCAPSRDPEGLPNVVLEAKLFAIPSVAFNFSSFPELITHRVDGWLAPGFGAEALAEGLCYFLEDSNRTRAAGAAARASLDRFDRATFKERWLGVFGQAHYS